MIEDQDAIYWERSGGWWQAECRLCGEKAKPGKNLDEARTKLADHRREQHPETGAGS